MQSTVKESANTANRYATIWVFLAYVVLVVAMTWPVTAQLGTRLAGGRDDLWIHQWTFWWVKQALLTGQNPFYTTLLYYPDGVALTSHNIAWFNIGLWLPLQAIIGSIAAYNVVFIAILSLNGFATYLFARELTQSSRAGFIGGLIVSFWPYILSHYDHPNMIAIFWVPLALLSLHRLVKQPATRYIMWGGICLAMIGITRWQLLLMSSPLLGGYLLYLLWTTRSTVTWRSLKSLLLSGLLAGLLMAPLAAPVVIDQFTRDFPEDAFLNETDLGRTDLLAYVTPNIHNAFWHDRVAPLYENFAANKLYAPFLGYMTLIIAFVGVYTRWPESRFWLLLALLYLVLALGSQLVINGRIYPHLPMPYRLVEDWTVFRIIRRPHRLNIFLSLPIAMIAAWGITAVEQRFAASRRLVLTGIIAGLILVEYSVIPFPTTSLTAPDWYEQMSLEGENTAVLDLPHNSRGYDKWYMAYQTTHEMPMMGGHVSRLPREAFAFMRDQPFLASVLDEDSQANFAISDVTHQLQSLAEKNVNYIVIHKQFANEGLITMWRDWLTFAPHYEDDEVIVYRTDPQFGRDFTWEHPLTDSLGLIRAAFSPAAAVQSGTVKVDARWGTAAAPDTAYDVCFQFADAAGDIAQTDCQPVEPNWPSARWQADEVVRSFYVLPVVASLAPGSYLLSLRLAESETGEMVGETAVLGPLTIHSSQPQFPSHITWDNQISLTGFDLNQTADSLAVTFFWQARQAMDSSYKLFVHLIDPATGQPVVQSDVIPRGWTYPTNIWESGELVRDELTLSLSGVPTAEYELWLGFYDEATGQRLPVSTPDSLPIQNEAVRLTMIKH